MKCREGLGQTYLSLLRFLHMKVAFSPVYVYRLPEGHRFPMDKYDLLSQQLVYENIIQEDQFFHPQSCPDEILLMTHTKDYLDKLTNLTLSRKEERRIGFPVRDDLIARGRVIAHGTIECALHAIDGGVALNIAGGTHHAFRDRGEGFCIFNDFAIASNFLLETNRVKKILIVDLDVHQGNGTANIFQGDDRVFTFSMHGRQNYPLKKEFSDLDIELEIGMKDDEYLSILEGHLPGLIDKVKPDLIFFLSGVDVLETDRLGKLGLSLAGCKRRDEVVFELCYQRGIPVAVSMGGGYSPQIKHIVNAHANTYKAAVDVFT
jgi:acetoin utilization deacetylase AcuC-like enzyme